MSENRDHRMQEKGRALVRGLHLSELQASGAARAMALHEADVQLDRIARLLPDALQAGLSLAEIARVAGVSRPTLYELRARYGGSVGDMRLAVLQTLANRGPLLDSELAEYVGGDAAARSEAISRYLGTCIEIDPGPDNHAILSITGEGLELLDAWVFQIEDVEDNEAEDVL